MEIDKYIEYLYNQQDIVAYRRTKDLGNNDYYVSIVKTNAFSGKIIYYMYNIYNVHGTHFCRDLLGFSSYNTIELAIEAMERVCGRIGGNVTVIKL